MPSLLAPNRLGSPSQATAARRKQAKKRLLQMHYESKVGHIGGNLSALDVMLTLHHDVMLGDDQFVLSKGHSAGAYYITLWTLGLLEDAELRTFHGDNTRLSGHPPAFGIPEILFATGSLGHGVGLAAGLALGKRLTDDPGQVFCLTSDGEWNEGSNWEALIFARHQRLSNLTLVVDLNGLQGFGTTQEVADLSPLAAKFRAFGVPTIEVDGHNSLDLKLALQAQGDDGPVAVVAKTVKGHGVSFMEHRMEWHYLPMTDADYAQAVSELGDA